MIRHLYMIELTVADWEHSVAWYRDTLGLKLEMKADTDRYALFQAGFGRIALKAGKPQSATVLLSFEVDDLVLEIQRLRSLGVVPRDAIKTSPEGYRRAIISDPDGYAITLFEWNFSLPEECH
jgi:predicted enzyme related to lactoylglutathione lyase